MNSVGIQPSRGRLPIVLTRDQQLCALSITSTNSSLVTEIVPFSAAK